MAEIMARAAKAQQIVPKAGLIQHKPVSETVMSRKEREERRRKPGSLNTKKTAARGSAPINARGPGEKPSASRLAQAKTDGKARPASSGSDMPEKKFPKAAAATTGYRGTARPPPQKSSDSRNGQAGSSRGRSSGGILDPPKYGRRYRDDDDDPELDDFIDYDDEEEPVRNFDYDSDGSSDMEAGMDDIYREETRAEREAREEDRREEEMLARLKREKEERKKRTGS
jgi:protein SPT2